MTDLIKFLKNIFCQPNETVICGLNNSRKTSLKQFNYNIFICKSL